MKANREQQEIIDDRNKNILLYASAGTGKTFAVAQKVAAEIGDGIAPQEILCLTFTIKACEEIAQELARYGVTDGVTVKTIHGFCLSLIEEEAKGASCKYSEPTVIDESDEEEILQRLVSEILTRSELSEWIRSNKIADSVSELVKKDVVYLPPVGFFWKIERNGETLYCNSRRMCKREEEIKPLLSAVAPSQMICPDCGKRQSDKGNTCGFCGFDFRTYLKPQKYDTDGFRNLISEIKRLRERYGFTSSDAADDFQKTFDRLRREHGQRLSSLVSNRFQKGRAVDLHFLDCFSRHAGEIVNAYQTTLFKSNKLDFDDLILQADQLLRDESVRRRWQRYRLIVVDEMQDTSLMEYSVLKKIFAQSRVMMCGDPFQTIYEWRGSVPLVIEEDFLREFCAQKYLFAENYRSTKLLTKATFGYLRNAYPDEIGNYFPEDLRIHSQEEGEAIRSVQCRNASQEAQFLYRYLQKQRTDGNADVCIMTRSNRYIANLYRELTDYGMTLPQEERLQFFTVDEDYRFFKRPVVKDLLAFYSVLVNGSDHLSLERLAERYIRGVGEATLSKLREGGAGVRIASFSETGDPFLGLTEALKSNRIVVYDLETTGLDVVNDAIVQLAAARIDQSGEIVERFERFVIAERSISEGAFATHGLRLDDLKALGGVTAKQALEEFSAFAKGSLLVGHNSKRFDRIILDRQLAENAIPPLDVIGEYDTMELFRLFCPEAEDARLETMCRRFGVENERAHDAFSDVSATGRALIRLIRQLIIPTAAERNRLIARYETLFRPFFAHIAQMKSLLSVGKVRELHAYLLENFAVFTQHDQPSDRAAAEELFGAVERDTEEAQDKTAALKSFLKDAVWSGGRSDFLKKRCGKIPIITVHQSKGCEFDTVMIAGTDKLNFPNYASVRSGHEREERRIFYVAMTRAKNKLIFTHYRHAVSADGYSYCREPSEYLGLIPQECIRYYQYKKEDFQ